MQLVCIYFWIGLDFIFIYFLMETKKIYHIEDSYFPLESVRNHARQQQTECGLLLNTRMHTDLMKFVSSM